MKAFQGSKVGRKNHVSIVSHGGKERVDVGVLSRRTLFISFTACCCSQNFISLQGMPHKLVATKIYRK